MSNADGQMMPWSKITVNDAVLTVWPGSAVKQNDLPKLMAFFKSEFGIEPTPVGCVKTLPDKDAKGNKIKGTGGRHDFFFFVKMTDVWEFAGPRLAFGMRWWQDIYFNNQENIYPLEFRRAYPSENW